MSRKTQPLKRFKIVRIDSEMGRNSLPDISYPDRIHPVQGGKRPFFVPPLRRNGGKLGNLGVIFGVYLHAA
jgi:hypothetical protein